MVKKIRIIASDSLCIGLIISLLGCSMGWEQRSNPAVTQSILLPSVAKVIDEQWSVVSPYFEDGMVARFEETGRSSNGTLDGEAIVTLTLLEEQGQEYLQFCHAVANSYDGEAVLQLAQDLVTKEEYTGLQARFKETERSLQATARLESRGLPPSQRSAFLRDLQKMITRTLVLLVAGIVYACIPDVVFWGKVSAAAAIAVAAGIVSTTVLSLYRHYTSDSGSSASGFQEWITDVTTDPTAAYAVACSMMSLGKTMTNGPVVTGLIIAVFSIYQVIDLVKPMLKKYTFNA